MAKTIDEKENLERTAVVVQDFDSYTRGDMISNEQEIAKILQEGQAGKINFIRGAN